MTASIDFATIIEPVARQLLGEPNQHLSSKTELRFGTHGSLSVEVAGEKRGQWYDHEASEGGGVLDLIARETGCANGAAVNWLSEHGFTQVEPKAKPWRQVASYDYYDAGGKLAFQVVRFEPKHFLQRRPDESGGWTWNVSGVERVPYRLPGLLNAAPYATVFICEGERDCDTLHERGLIATTNPGGAGKWADSYSSHLAGRNVAILPDHDEPGEAHALDVARKLTGIARSIRIIRLPNLPPKGDVSDWIASGGTAEELEKLAGDTPEWTRDPQPTPEGSSQDTQSIIRIIDPTTLEHVAVPSREWIVEGWLPVGSVTGNYGDGGTGKTLLAQQLQTACGTGIPWCGLQVLRCKSFGLYCEDSEDELHRRQHDINSVFGRTYSQLSDMRWISGVGDDWTLANFATDGRMHKTERWDLLVREIKTFGARVVALDTVADLFGGNENDRSQVRRFISLLAGLARDINGAVLLNCHPSRSGLSTGNLDGGSTGWSNTFRSRWSLARPDGEDVPDDTPERVLTKRKANYARIGETLRLRWTNGAFVSLLSSSGAGTFDQAVRGRVAEDVFLRLLDRCENEGQRVSGSATANNYAPAIFAKRGDREGLTKPDLRDAMQRLFDQKRIATESYGRNGDKRTRLIRAPDSAATDV